MGQSKQRPLDRKSRVWCKACEQWVGDKGWNTGGKPTSCPNDVTKIECICGAVGSLVFVFDDKVGPGPTSLTVQPQDKQLTVHKPHCGDETCEGYCADPLCMPDVKEENKKLARTQFTPFDICLAFVFGSTFGSSLMFFFIK